jgi:hypothetical protein
MVMKKKLLPILFLIFICAVFVFVFSVSAANEKSFTLVEGLNLASITEPMVEQGTVAAISGSCGLDGHRILKAWIHDDVKKKFYFMKGTVEYKAYPEGTKDGFSEDMIGKGLWLDVEGSGPCTLSCDGGGCLEDTSVTINPVSGEGDTRPLCQDDDAPDALWKCITRTGACSQNSCSADGTKVLEWFLDTGSKCSDSSKDCYKHPTRLESCDNGCSNGECLEDCDPCEVSESNPWTPYEGVYCDGTIPIDGGEDCDSDKRPAYRTCREGCQPIENSCQYHSDCSSIKPSSFIAHEDGSVSLIVDTDENKFCRILVGPNYYQLDEDDFDEIYPKIGCKNIDNVGYTTTKHNEGGYAIITLTNRHQCKLSNVDEGTKIRIGCADGFFNHREDVPARSVLVNRFEKTDGTYEEVDLEIMVGSDITNTVKFKDIANKDITIEESFEIDSLNLPELRVTIVKGNGAVGREEVSNRNLIWETDRKTLCHIKSSPGDPPRGNVANSGELWYSHEVYTNEGIRYISCRDEYGNENIHPYIIDQTGPEVDRLEVTSDDGDGNGNYKITITWRELTDASGIKQYHVRARKDNLYSNSWYFSDVIKLECGDSLQPAGAGATHKCVATEELDRDSTYYFGVRAEDGAGNMGKVFTKAVETVPSSCESACKITGIDDSEAIAESNCVGENVVIPGEFDDVEDGDICCCFK